MTLAFVRDCLQTDAVLLRVTDDIHILVLKQSQYLSWGLAEVGMFRYLLLNHQWIYLLVLVWLCHYWSLWNNFFFLKKNCFLFFTLLFRLISVDKSCNASFMFNESLCCGGWLLIDFTSTTFGSVLLFCGE